MHPQDRTGGSVPSRVNGSSDASPEWHGMVLLVVLTGAAVLVGLTDPRLIVGMGLLVLTLVLIRARALLRQPHRPRLALRRSVLRSVRARVRDRAGRAPN